MNQKRHKHLLATCQCGKVRFELVGPADSDLLLLLQQLPRSRTSVRAAWRDQGKVQQARELLAPVYGWFTEGFDTRDLKEAKAWLEELAA